MHDLVQNIKDRFSPIEACMREVSRLLFIWAAKQETCFRVSDKVRFKLACSATETSYKIENLLEESLYMILSKLQITKALIRLGECTGWSAPLLFTNHRRQVFSCRCPYHFHFSFSAWFRVFRENKPDVTWWTKHSGCFLRRNQTMCRERFRGYYQCS